jgi:hypothetical protein
MRKQAALREPVRFILILTIDFYLLKFCFPTQASDFSVHIHRLHHHLFTIHDRVYPEQYGTATFLYRKAESTGTLRYS